MPRARHIHFVKIDREHRRALFNVQQDGLVAEAPTVADAGPNP
jgi:hypothetical protein